MDRKVIHVRDPRPEELYGHLEKNLVIAVSESLQQSSSSNNCLSECKLSGGAPNTNFSRQRGKLATKERTWTLSKAAVSIAPLPPGGGSCLERLHLSSQGTLTTEVVSSETRSRPHYPTLGRR